MRNITGKLFGLLLCGMMTKAVCALFSLEANAAKNIAKISIRNQMEEDFYVKNVKLHKGRILKIDSIYIYPEVYHRKDEVPIVVKRGQQINFYIYYEKDAFDAKGYEEINEIEIESGGNKFDIQWQTYSYVDKDILKFGISQVLPSDYFSSDYRNRQKFIYDFYPNNYYHDQVTLDNNLQSKGYYVNHFLNLNIKKK